MFVFNVKVNGSKIFKIFFIFIIIIMIIILGIVFHRVISGANNNFTISDSIDGSGICKITSKSYTNILKTVHEDIDSYVGKKINFTGYIYRVSDLQDNQFVLARNMIINSSSQSVVVGFLCEYDNSKDFDNNTWVEITGEIKKGSYHGDMPIVVITDIKKVNTPSDEYVYPPNDSYIPTSGIL